MITTTCLILWMSWRGAAGRFSPLDAAPPVATTAAQRTTPTNRLTPRTRAKAIRVDRRQASGVMKTLRSRGPSSSQKKIPCHVPSARRPSFSGTSTCGPISDARMCDGAFSSPSSMCCQPQSSPTMRSSAASKSRATAGSACSLIVTPAVVCGTNTSAALAASAPSSAACTSDVMSISWVRRSVRTRICCIVLILGAMAAMDSRELDEYRERIDRFIADLDQEYYDHYAGLKEEFELEPIYSEYEDVTSLERARRMQEASDGSFGSIELWRFACEGYLGALTRTHEERSAELEATLKAPVDGEEIPFRMLRPTIANSADRDRRERVERGRHQPTQEDPNPNPPQTHHETHQ